MDQTHPPERIKSTSPIKIGVLIASYSLLVYLLWRLFPEEYYVDWGAFRQSSLMILTGKSPYIIPGVYNPPWTFLLLAPLAILPVKVGGILLTFINLSVFAYIFRRLGGNFIAMIAFLLIPQIGLKIIINPNIDFLAALGFLLPPQIGLFFIAIKPQIGIAVVLYWLVEAYQVSWREVIRVFLPVGIASLVSFLLFGIFYIPDQNILQDNIWYAYPLWPYLIPAGLALLALAIRQKKIQWAILGSPFITPYTTSYSAVVAMLGLVNQMSLFIPAMIGFWITHLILWARGLGN